MKFNSPTLAILTASLVGASIASAEPMIEGQKIAEWQLAHMPPTPDTDWVRAAFYLGLSRWARAAANEKYLVVLKNVGERNKWALGPRIFHADDFLIGQVWADEYDRTGNRSTMEPTAYRLDYVLAHKPTVSLTFNGGCQDRWCWCDSLFMAPATWFAAARIYHNDRYRDYADSEFWKTKEFLFDPITHLFYRDSRYFSQRTTLGNKVFWGRGNAWVFAGLINIIKQLDPSYGERQHYINLFLEMAKALKPLQRGDGFWTTSLGDPPEKSAPESSATAFFSYGYLSGINMGLLDRMQYGELVRRGIAAIDRSTIGGKLGYVQQIGEAPDVVKLSDSQAYGSGAALLLESARINAGHK